MIINMIFCSPDQPIATDHELGPTLLSYTRQVALGLMYLSFKKFVHRDIAARNILVNDEGICKVHKVAWKSMESTSLCHRSKCSHNTFTAWTTIKILHLTMTLYSYVHTHTVKNSHPCMCGNLMVILLFRLLTLAYLEIYWMKTTMFLMEAKFLWNGQPLKP